MICPNCLYNVRPTELNNLEYDCPQCAGYSSKSMWESPIHSNFPTAISEQYNYVRCHYCNDKELKTAQLIMRSATGAITTVFACHRHYDISLFAEGFSRVITNFDENLWNCELVYDEKSEIIVKEIGINEEIFIGDKVRYVN